MRLFALLTAMMVLQACAPVPRRPAAVHPDEKVRFDECERQHSVCLMGTMPADQKIGTDPKSDQPQRYDNYYGSQSGCNKKLKNCYEREAR